MPNAGGENEQTARLAEIEARLFKQPKTDINDVCTALVGVGVAAIFAEIYSNAGVDLTFCLTLIREQRAENTRLRSTIEHLYRTQTLKHSVEMQISANRDKTENEMQARIENLEIALEGQHSDD